MNIYKNIRQGFIIVEAAIFLPIFIIGVLTFAYLIKFIAIQESVFHSFTDEAKIVAAESQMNPLSAAFFEVKLKDRIYDENRDNISNVDVERLLYLYQANGITGLISMDLSYDINIKLSNPFRHDLPVSESLLFRGFIGKEETSDPMPFDEMEKIKDSDHVWIFPRSGGKYHGDDCIYIKSEPRQIILTNVIRRKYDACGICDSYRLYDGSLVYYFRTGRSYHDGSCPSVDKYVISIEKEVAVEKGYTPCSKCGGA